MSTVALTGASGLIGTALRAALLARGDRVVTFIRGDVAQPDAVRWDPLGAVSGDDLARVAPLDGVIHLAGAGIADKRWTSARKDDIFTSRAQGTLTLAKALSTMGQPPRSFVCGSAIGWYGSRGDTILDETADRGDGFLADVCVAWENAADPLVQAGVPVSYARTGIVQSARGGALKKQLPLFRAGLGGRLGRGQQWLSPVSLSDEVAALLFLLDHQLTGPYNLTAPEPLTNAAFTSALARAVHRPAVATVPPLALRLALGSELADEAILASQRVVPAALLKAGFVFQHPDAPSILAAALED